MHLPSTKNSKLSGDDDSFRFDIDFTHSSLFYRCQEREHIRTELQRQKWRFYEKLRFRTVKIIADKRGTFSAF